MPTKKISTEERGWAGHFCAAALCLFRRNTLISVGLEPKVVVSTVGNYISDRSKDFKAEEMGYGRYYETMAFEAKFEFPYWEADISKQIYFDSDWTIDTSDRESDLKANEMHDKVVEELVRKLEK